jgi:putative FmdB family regulatory protein
MPTYEYRCGACGREIEVQQRMSDPDLVHCEACGADKLERLISWTSVRSDSWKAALKAPNPKEAFKGIAAVDRSTPKRFSETTTPPTTPTTPPTVDDETKDDDDPSE